MRLDGDANYNRQGFTAMRRRRSVCFVTWEFQHRDQRNNEKDRDGRNTANG